MEYKDNVTFAIRTLLMYKHLKDNHVFDDYQFTLATGTLLNVLSAILQENYHAIIDRVLLKRHDFQGLEEKNREGLKAYFRQIKESLATKTDGEHGNFVCEKEHGNISKIILRTNRDTKEIELSISDFEEILNNIEDVIKNDQTYGVNYQTEKDKFKTIKGV